MKGHHYYKQLVSGERNGRVERLLLLLLKGVAALYSRVMRLRALAYRYAVFSVKRLPLPVISVGNISMGGTGKTPTVLYLARELMARGKTVAVLTRGYGGTLEGTTVIVSNGDSLLLTPVEAGDEPCLLASSLPGLMVVMGSSRYHAGLLALKELSPDCFILDDGFQHQKLARDLDILLLDRSAPFLNGWTLPAGFLREAPTAASRADLVILTRADGFSGVPAGLPEGVPVCSSAHSLNGCLPLAGGDLLPLSALSGRRIVAFCGIADPESFFAGVETAGVKLIATLAFSDHCAYGPRELEALGKLKRQSRADCLVTTAKDAVKLRHLSGILGDCFVVQLELILTDSEPLLTALDRLF